MNDLTRTPSASIRMGEMSVAANGEELRTLLGSCIGLVLYDRRRKIGGLAHMVLPYARGKAEQPGKFIDTAIPALIDELEKLAGGEVKITAKLAGGASMFSTSLAANIGLQNEQACEQLLDTLRIPILAKHCGGEQGRRMSLNTANGAVMIEIAGRDRIEL